jgi:hypothetical protein
MLLGSGFLMIPYPESARFVRQVNFRAQSEINFGAVFETSSG